MNPDGEIAKLSEFITWNQNNLEQAGFIFVAVAVAVAVAVVVVVVVEVEVASTWPGDYFDAADTLSRRGTVLFEKTINSIVNYLCICI